ncbi:unnamed protein product, partial [marine sediment metagenome]
CSKCGDSLYGIRSHYRYVKNGKCLNNYHGYRCGNISSGICNLSIMGKIDGFVLDQIKKKISIIKTKITDGLKPYIDQNIRTSKKNNTEKEIRDIDEQFSRLLDSYLKGITDLELYQRKNNELKYRKEVMLKEQRGYSQNDMTYKIYKYVDSFDINKNLPDLDFDSKRELLSEFISKIEVAPSAGKGKKDYNDRLKIFWLVD